MNQFSLQKGSISPDSNNRFISGLIINADGKVIKKIKITAGFKYIHFNLGEEYSKDVKKLEDWMNIRMDELFDKFVDNPDSFKNDLIEEKFIS